MCAYVIPPGTRIRYRPVQLLGYTRSEPSGSRYGVAQRDTQGRLPGYTGLSMALDDTTVSFGAWVRRQRRALDLTQHAVAVCVGCSIATIKKIEADERRPSRRMAERLAGCLQLGDERRRRFLEVAQRERA